MQEGIELIRSRGGPRRNAHIEGLMRRWQTFRSQTYRNSQDELRDFAAWLINRSGLVVPTEAHREAMARQSVDLAGDKQMLCLVGEVERGRADLTFALGAGRTIYGAGELRPGMLPAEAREGDYLLLTLSWPVCRLCGFTNEQAAADDRSWILPYLCSRCFIERNKRSRREP